MSEKKTAIIIGAGIGGITTAVYLAQKGYSIRVFEKNSSPGGRCGQIIRDGYRFDLGATMLLMPGIYHKVFDSLGIRLEEETDIIRLENLYELFYENGDKLVFTTDREKMELQLERIEPGSFAKEEKYVSEGYKIFRLSFDKLINRNFYNLFQLTNFQNLGLLIRLKTYISNWSYAKKFFKNVHLLMAYTFQNIYVGQSPFNSPALFSMIPAAELTEGSFFPKGGMFAIVEKLLSAAENAGVKFHFNSNVCRIKISSNKAEGIVLEDGTEVNSGIVIANADLPFVYRKLLPDRRKSEHIDRLQYSCSAICFHWGLDKYYPQLGHHNVFMSDSFEKGLDRIFIDKSVNERPTFYIHAPARTDPSAAPANHDSLSVIVGTGHIDKTKNQDWNEMKLKTRNAVIERLRRFGLEDIEKHIKVEICLTPENWESTCNISRGSVFGSIGHNMLQMGYFRPHNRHDKYHNLYFVGGSTHPGNGIPNILLSAKLVTERIMSGK